MDLLCIICGSIMYYLMDKAYVLADGLYIINHLGNTATPDWMIPTITPNSPSALPKISMTRILTKVSAV